MATATVLLLSVGALTLGSGAAQAERWGSMTYDSAQYTQTFTQTNAAPVVATYTSTGSAVVPSTGAAMTPGNGILAYPVLGALTSQFSPAVPTGTQVSGYAVGAGGCLAPGDATRVVCADRGSITISFDRPVTNPRLLLIGLGASNGAGTYLNASGTLTSQPAGATMSVAGTDTNLEVLSGTTFRTVSADAPLSCGTVGNHAGCGTVQVSGSNLTSITLTMSLQVSGGGGALDAAFDAFSLGVSLSNQALPTAAPDTALATSTSMVGIVVQANDTAATGIPLIATSTVFPGTAGWTVSNAGKTLTRAAQGVYQVQPDGTVTFDPVNSYVGVVPVVSYRITDAAGSTATSTITTTVVPAAPVLDTPLDSSLSNDNTPTYAGTAMAGSTVAVFLDGNLIGAAVAGSGGGWSLTPVGALPDGNYTARANATISGYTGPSSGTHEFTVDATPPAAPVIVSPAQASIINDSTPAITGTAEARATVELQVDGAAAVTVNANDDGDWTYIQSTPLPNGARTVTARQTDLAGNTGPLASNSFTVDTVAPLEPVISAPVNGSSTNDATPQVSGTGEPGAALRLWIDGVGHGPVSVNGAGAWSFTPATALSEGSHTLLASQTDAAGNTSPTSTPTSFTVDTVPPAAPVVTGPADGSTTPDNTPLLTGTAEPGSVVTVSVDAITVGSAGADGTGQWSLVQPSVLLDGPHTVRAQATDAVGNTGPVSGLTSFLVDTTPPPAPVIIAPADGSLTADSTPNYSGTAEPNSTVRVFVDGTPVGTATASAAGTWTLTQPAELSDGAHTVRATATDTVGNLGPSSTPSSFIVDTLPPAAPVVTSPTQGALLADATPLISGTGEPGATLTLTLDGTQYGPLPVDAAGTWSYLPITDLAEGAHTVTATQTDPVGHISPASPPRTFTVDTVAPAAPAIDSPSEGEQLPDTRPVITGSGEAGATVTVEVDGTTLGTAVVDGAGRWTFAPAADLTDGPHSVSATQTDPAGNTGPASAAVSFTVDTVAPSAPVVLAPGDGSVSNDTTPTYQGSGEPGATVQVSVDGAPVGQATVDGAGTWSLTPATPRAPGVHIVTATQTDPAGNLSPVSGQNAFTIDTQPPAAPILVNPADGSITNDTTPVVTGTGEPGATVVVSIDGTVVGSAVTTLGGSWSLQLNVPLSEAVHSASAIQTDPAGNPSPTSTVNSFEVDTTAADAPLVFAPADGAHLLDNTPQVTGSGEPGHTVRVLIDGSPVGTDVVDGAGDWTLALTTPLGEGSHTVSATQTDAGGNTSPASALNTFTIDTLLPPAPVVLTPAAGSVTRDSTPLITGTGEPGAQVTVLLDGASVGNAVVTAAATWSFTVPTPLEDGSHTVSATQTDLAGNTGPESLPHSFTVDTLAPAVPSITSPADGAQIATTTPTITGSAEPGAQVSVIVDGAGIGTVQADGAGTWSLPQPTPLAQGGHTVRARATDAAGNGGPPSATHTFFVETVVPAAPVVLSPAAGARVADTTPEITGTGEPGATVTVRIDGTELGTATVGATGSWTLTPSTPLSQGEHAVSASQADAAGNLGPPAGHTFTIDTQAPAAPVLIDPADGSSTSNTTPVYTGTGEPGATVTVTVDGTAIGTSPVAADGRWSRTSPVPLAEGVHQVSAAQTDPTGNASGVSALHTFTVDTAAPSAPVITSPTEGMLTRDTTPQITGTGEAGATVAVSIDDVMVGTTTAAEDGSWTFLPPTPLATGAHTVSASQSDAAGNDSPSSAPVGFVVDGTVPAAPVILQPVDGTVTTQTGRRSRVPVSLGRG